MKTKVCLRIFLLSICLSINGLGAVAFRPEQIIGRIGLEEARDWVDINRQILNHRSVDKVTRGRMRRELQMLRKRLTVLQEELGDSAVDEISRSIIEGCFQDIDRLLDRESSRAEAPVPPNIGSREIIDRPLGDLERESSGVEAPVPTNIGSRERIERRLGDLERQLDQDDQERQKYQQLVSVLSDLQELKHYRDEAKQTVKVVHDTFYSTNAEETLRKSFVEAGCNMKHYKAWGMWMYVECWDILKKHDNARIALDESIRQVEESGSVDPAGMNRIRREMKKWRTDHRQLMRLMNQIVKLYTDKGLVLQQCRQLDWKDRAAYKQLNDRMEAIQGEINTLQAMVKEPGRLEPFPSLKQEDTSKDPNQEPQPRPLEELVNMDELVNNANRITELLAEEDLTIVQKIQAIIELEKLKEDIENRLEWIQTGAGREGPEGERRLQELHSTVNTQVAGLRRAVDGELDHRPDSVVPRPEDFDLEATGFRREDTPAATTPDEDIVLIMGRSPRGTPPADTTPDEDIAFIMGRSPRGTPPAATTPDVNAASGRTSDSGPTGTTTTTPRTSGSADTPNAEAADHEVRTMETTHPDGRRATLTIMTTEEQRFEDWLFEDGSRERRMYRMRYTASPRQRHTILDDKGNIEEMTYTFFNDDGSINRVVRWHSEGVDDTYYYGDQQSTIRRDTAHNVID